MEQEDLKAVGYTELAGVAPPAHHRHGGQMEDNTNVRDVVVKECYSEHTVYRIIMVVIIPLDIHSQLTRIINSSHLFLL